MKFIEIIKKNIAGTFCGEKNSLREIFYKHNGRLINKWDHYLDIYDLYFSKYRNTNVRILEIGISQGGSLQLWRKYFGKKATIFGMDINPECKKLEEDGIEILIGSQEDRNFLKNIKNKIGKVDILIDDGGHMMNQQIITFDELFDLVDENGIYLCEDLHTSYWKEFGGNYKGENTFIEKSKGWIDSLNAWHSHDLKEFSADKLTKSLYSIHYYDSIVVFEKRPIDMPKKVKIGKKVIKDMEFESDFDFQKK